MTRRLSMLRQTSVRSENTPIEDLHDAVEPLKLIQCSVVGVRVVSDDGRNFFAELDLCLRVLCEKPECLRESLVHMLAHGM